MIIGSVCGEQISIVENKHGILVDTRGRWWCRNSDKDVPDKAAAYTNNDVGDTMLLSRPMLKRVCQGNNAIQQLTTVAEMRDYISRLKSDLRAVGDNMNDQQLREILIEAETDGKSCICLLLHRLNVENGKQQAAEIEECVSCKTEGTSLEPERLTGTDVPPKKKAKGKPKEYAFRGTYADTFIQLTEKQVAMMLAVARVSRTNQTLQVVTAAVLREVASEIPPISAGAVLSTLREKHLIAIDKVAGVINPTSSGAWVMDELTHQTRR
nr:MAG TPA: hypothetical protein [Caudoviricetes sp.]